MTAPRPEDMAAALGIAPGTVADEYMRKGIAAERARVRAALEAKAEAWDIAAKRASDCGMPGVETRSEARAEALRTAILELT